MQHPSFKEKARYYFENTISSGPAGVIKWLAVLSLVIVVILGFVIMLFSIEADPDQGPLGFIEGSWQVLMSTIDPGAMGGDNGWAFRAVRFVATLGSLFLISILIGSISSGIDGKIDELKKGRSRVLETNHTLILGWSEKVFSIISEIIIANENQKKPSIVIMADRDKVEMEDEIRAKIEDFKNTKIIVRSGSPLELTDIAVVSPNAARSIIVLAPEEGNVDTHVIKSVLALTNGRNRKEGKYNIVAEIKDPKNMEAAHLVGNDETVFVLSQDLISRVTAQTCRQSGLSVVYSELLQFDGDEIYFQEEPKLTGKTYKEALFSYESSSVMGIYRSNGEVLINPELDTVFEEGDSVIAISEDDDTVVVSGKTAFAVDENVFERKADTSVKPEKTLVLGWNAKGVGIINELDNYVAEGSEVFILADMDLSDEMEELKNTVQKQRISFRKGDINDRATLDELHPELFDHIILLSYTEDIDIQESDAKTLICLLHLRNISEKLNKNFSIVSEMLDIRNRELGVVAKADDFIVGENMVSMMLSQLSENSELKKVYDILFEAEGSEIYLKPVDGYVKTGIPMDFYTVLESAAQINQSAIGYRIVADSGNPSKNFGIKINPNKADKVTFNPGDYIIVLAED